MSYNYKDPEITFKKVTFKSSEYLYVRQYDRNIEDPDERETYAYIELLNFYFKKEGKVLILGNHLGQIYSLTGYTECMVKRWIDDMKKVISFP
tara:strand:- start:216 stop:494 length:279 start_codon:yes stop_codon:yes gene_type:complete